MPASGEIPLAEGAVHHLRDVLRLAAGEEIIVVSGGVATRVRLTEVGERVAGERLEDLPVRGLPRVTLAQGLAKGDKMDDVVRQATEVGISRVVPFAADRSVVRLDTAKAAARTDRWRRIAAEAAQQSQRADIPQVHDVVAADALPDVLAGSVVLVCWEDATCAEGIAEAIARLAPSAGTDVAVVVGPEGGLTQREVGLLESAGALSVTLGATVLRTETAGVVASALAVHARGGLGARRG